VTKPFERIWPLEGFLSARSMAEGIPRVATSAAVVALVASALITIKGITGSLKSEVVSWGTTVEHKLFVSPGPPTTRERVERLASVPGIVGFESLGLEVNSPFVLRGIRSKDAGFTGPLRDPEIAKRFEESESLLVSTPLARALHMTVGQEIPIGVPSGPPRLFRILAISDEVGYFPPRREYAVTHEKWMTKYFCLKSDDVITKYALRMEDGADPDATAKAVATALADLPHPPEIRTGVSWRDYEVADIDRDFRLFDLILGLVAILAGIGVLNALLIAAFERRKEIGVLKAIGMTKGQLAGSVVVEAATTGVLGGFFGVLLGSAFIWIAIDALSRLTGLPLAAPFEPIWLFVAFFGGILLAVLAAAFPVMRANQFSAAEAVRYE
jgi:putative ABC transport system permease protein